jgi:hypothetical protein
LKVDGADNTDEEVVYMSLLLDGKNMGVAVFDAVTARLRTLQLDISSQLELGGVKCPCWFS